MNNSESMLLAATVLLCGGALAQAPVADLSAVDASVKGAVTMTAGGPRVMSGSSVSAGESTAQLRLLRGGELRLCPRSSISITASPSGRELMLAMNTGAVEVHYPLASSKDTILTPDFLIMLIGPGEFHIAIGADVRGSTCVRALQRNTAAVVIEEQMGDGIRQLGPGEAAVFHNGSVKEVDNIVPPSCGCPAVAATIQEARASEPHPIPPLEDPAPKLTDPGVHVEIDVPFVFKASEMNVPPPPQVATLHLGKLPPEFAKVAVQPPKPKESKGFFFQIRARLARIFR
jgi:hypothetical protein